MSEEIFARIKQQISENDIMLYMKGSKSTPQCGFSAVVVNILNQLNLEYEIFDVLTDSELRQAIKDFSDWPTIPQLYIKGNFIGGCDIIKEMFQSGELQALIGKNNERSIDN